jgi:DNA modification methylase
MVECIDMFEGNDFTLYRGDCVEVVSQLPDKSIGFSVYSPPFASLYVYSDSERDMGNCETDQQFFEHYKFLTDQLFRVLKPGRLVSVHCMNLPSTISNDGYIGIRDFRGEIIRCHQSSGFIYHSEVCIWKDPVTAMQRTKALGLLHKQVCKDSSMSRQGIPDYVCTFRKPGKNLDPIAGEFDHFAGDSFVQTGNLSIDIWQRYASPVWMDINQSNTLNVRAARADDDTRHICPLQLDVIHRCLQLWSKSGDVVLSPFAGIGSEGYESLKLDRKFIGVELKDTYFEQAKKNLVGIEKQRAQPMLPIEMEC